MTTSTEVPGLLPCAIDGHAYLCNADYERTTVPVMRQQADTSTEAGEQSLNPQGLWRRSQESWHHGAGQDFLDGRMGDTPPDPHRFRSSKGIDPWTKGQISLLHPTLRAWSTTAANLHLAVAYGLSGPFALYVSDGTELYWATVPFGRINTLAGGQGGGWTPTNATIATTQVTRFTLTATSGAAVSAVSPTGTNGVPVDPDRDYSVIVWSVYVSGGAAKTVRISVTWYDAAGASISTTANTVSGTDDSGNGGTAVGTYTSPSTAAYAAVNISYTANWANGEIHRIQSVNIAPDGPVGSVSPDNFKTSVINAGQAVQTIQSLATDGTYVWAALGVSGLHRTLGLAEVSTADVPAAPVGGQISLVGYANGFLLAAGSATATGEKNVLWVVNDPLGTPALSAIKTHPNTTFTWTGIGPGRGCVYAWGNSGGNGEVYKILFDPNTGALSTAASFATYLPDGETIHALQFYAGGIIMGTGKGVRIGTADGAGNIDYGPLIHTDWPVQCLEPQDRYCWFGWSRYAADASGLGRIDLGFFTDTMTPAWASDLMTPSEAPGVIPVTGDVVSAVTYAPYGYNTDQRPPVRVFSIATKGVYIEDPTSREVQGRLLTGTSRFSTSEPKTTRSIDVRHHALPAASMVILYMERDSSGDLEAIDQSDVAGSYGPAVPISLLDEQAEAMEFSFNVMRPNPATDYTLSPEMTRWTAKVLPLPSTIDETFVLTLQMKEYIVTSSGTKRQQNVPAEVTFLKGLERSREIVEFQLGSETFEGYVAQSRWKGIDWNNPLREFAEGTLTVELQTVRG